MFQTTKISLKKRLFSSSGWAFFTMMVWESVESLLEYAIAYLISSAITLLVIKFVATFLIITTTQTMLKPTQRFCMTFIKKLTYKKGEDKVKILKTIWNLVKANKCSIVVILVSALLGASGASVIDVNALPEITLGDGQVIEAVIQEEDVVATETIYGKEAVLATETIYGKPIFATEVVWEKEPVLATEVVWEVEPVIATEVIYEVEPIIADKLTFIANTVIYEDNNTTIKYNVGDIVANAEISKYTDKVDVYKEGDVIVEGTVLYNIGDTIIEGVKKYDIGDVIEEGVKKHDIGDYLGNEILYNVGDVLVPAEILYNVGDVITPAGTVLKEAEVIPATNVTPYLYYIILSVVVALAGVFFESPKDYETRKEADSLKKQAQKEIKAEEKAVATTEEQKIAEQKQKLADAEKAKVEEEKRIKLDQIKAEIRAEKAS